MAFAESLGLCLFCRCNDELTLLAAWDDYWTYDDTFAAVDENGELTCTECGFHHGKPPTEDDVQTFVRERAAR